jgi:ABC-2 type transport system permease protein
MTNATRSLTTARRVLTQLRHDPRTVAMLLLVPCMLETLLWLMFKHRPDTFDAIGASLLALFPLTTVFLVTSVALLRERTTGTLERLMTTPLGRFELIAGYALSFGLCASAQAGLASALTLGPLGLTVRGPAALVVLMAGCVALLGMGLGLSASAFARTEFQVVQFFPVVIIPQLLLCGLLIPRRELPAGLHAISDVMPMSYAVDGMHHLTLEATVSHWFWIDVAIVLAFAVGALMVGAVTLRRRTD